MNSEDRTATFITLEGVEGSGKSVQIDLLEREFQRRSIPYVRTREPGGTAFGEEVRQIVLRRDGAVREPISELLLYLADRYQDVREVILPALARGRHVICDRYHDATLAYQGYARGIGFEKIDRLAQALDIPRPDLTLVLDIDVGLGVKRARQRMTHPDQAQWSRFEDEAMAFHRKVRRGYRLLSEREPGRIRIVDASGAPEQVFSRIVAVLVEREVFPPRGESAVEVGR